jgi:hypothetical protein
MAELLGSHDNIVHIAMEVWEIRFHVVKFCKVSIPKKCRDQP